jgi:hypothetical protein
MRATASNRSASRIDAACVAPYLITLTLVAGLLVAWAGLCAI